MSAHFLQEFILIIIAAFIGGFTARSIRLPSVVGYVISGVVLGVVAKDFIHSHSSLHSLAELGVSLLLFTLGFEISPETFKKIHKRVFIAGILQVVLTTVALIPIFLFFGLSMQVSILFSLVCSFSSTVVIVKILEEKGKLNSFPGNHVFTYLLIQDLFVVPVIFFLPLLFSSQAISQDQVVSMGLSFFRVIAVFAVLWILSRLFLSRVLSFVYKYPSHELTILASIFVATISIGVLKGIGLPDSLAAFLAGVLISEQGKNLIPMSDIRPFREILLVLFFVVNGMLLSTSYLGSSIFVLLVLIILVLLIKFIVIFFILTASRYIPSASLFISSHLANVGEFAVVVGQLAFLEKYINTDDFNMILSIFILSLLFLPGVSKASTLLHNKIEKIPMFKHLALQRKNNAINRSDLPDLSSHVIIAGYGVLGRELHRVIELANIPSVIIDFDKKSPSLLKHKHHVIFGDAADDQVLESAHIRTAKILIVTIRDKHVVKKITTRARSLNKEILVFSFAKTGEERQDLMDFGVSHINHPELEAALSIGDKVLRVFGVMAPERSALLEYRKNEEKV